MEDSDWDDAGFDDGDADADDDFDDFGVDDDLGMQYGEESQQEASVQFQPSSEVWAQLEKMTEQVKEFAGVDLDDALALLYASKWNVEDCISAYMEDSAQSLKRAGVRAADDGAAAAAPPGETLCSVCFDDIDASAPGVDMCTPLACGHSSCPDCWRAYVVERVNDHREWRITCLGSGCEIVVPRRRILNFLTDALKQRYNNLILDSLLSSKRNMKWCPTPECDTVVTAEISQAKELRSITCRRCEQPFCFRCGEDHAPATCEFVREFEKRCSVDGGSIQWLVKNAKECPQCAAFIEKNGGCNWVKCFKCKFEFCWLCGRHIKHREIDAAGGDHKCNVFKEGEQEQIEERASAAERQRKQDDRRKFAHYHSRYMAHRDSYMREQTLFDRLKKTALPRGEDRKLLWEAQSEGLSRLRVARRALWSSYILGYYQKWDSNNSRKGIFEDLQHLLESRTEALSEVIEASFDRLGGESDAAGGAAAAAAAAADAAAVDAADAQQLQSSRAEVIRNIDAVRVNMNNLIDVCERDIVKESASA